MGCITNEVGTLRAVWVMCGLWLVLLVTFRLSLVTRLLRISVPTFVDRELTFSLAWFFTTIWASQTRPTSTGVYLGGVVSLLLVVPTWSRVVVATRSTTSLRHLLGTFKHGDVPRAGWHHVVVIDSGRRMSPRDQTLLLNCARSLGQTHKYDARRSDSALEEASSRDGDSLMAVFWSVAADTLFSRAMLMQSSLRCFGPDFEQYALRNSAAVVVLDLGLRAKLHQQQGDGLEALIGEAPERIQDWARHRFAAAAQAAEAIHPVAHLAPCPVVLLGRLVVADSDPIGYEDTTATAFEPAGPARLITRVVNLSGAPVVESDRRLPAEHRRFVRELGAEGLAPVADAYLRFRLSKSDVERFLGLVDCFEVLIKYSVVLLHCARADQNRGEYGLTSLGPRPTLGTWVSTLKRSVAEGLTEPFLVPQIGQAVTRAWSQPLEGAPRELVDLVNGVGLSWRGEIPRSHLAWLDWLTWLRNNTKGHGGLSEEAYGPVWSQLHEAFVGLAYDLRPITIEARLLAQGDEDAPVCIAGWQRGPYRSSTLRKDPTELPRIGCFARVLLVDTSIDLRPWTWLAGSRCLSWNREVGESAEYTDYATGRIERIQIDRTLRSGVEA